jgi:hypothetical protein
MEKTKPFADLVYELDDALRGYFAAATFWRELHRTTGRDAEGKLNAADQGYFSARQKVLDVGNALVFALAAAGHDATAARRIVDCMGSYGTPCGDPESSTAVCRESMLSLKAAADGFGAENPAGAEHDGRQGKKRRKAGAPNGMRQSTIDTYNAIANAWESGEDNDDDESEIENELSGQALAIYRDLRNHGIGRWKSFGAVVDDTVAYWRKGKDSTPAAVVSGLKRLRDCLNSIESSPVALKIDQKHERTKLEA